MTRAWDQLSLCAGSNGPWKALLLLLLLAGTAAGQLSTGSLRGFVTDPSGAVIIDANVVITNASTERLERALSTDQNGNYAAEALSPGVYNITITKPGFAARVQRVELQVGRVAVLNATLKVGSVEEKVTVAAAVPGVDSQDSEIAGVVEPGTIASLPLNGRQFGDLASLLPGALPAPNFDPIQDAHFPHLCRRLRRAGLEFRRGWRRDL